MIVMYFMPGSITLKNAGHSEVKVWGWIRKEIKPRQMCSCQAKRKGQNDGKTNRYT